MEEHDYQLLIVGLPEAGKTSFIHALDDLLQRPQSPDALRSYGLALDRTYLERDKKTFRAGKKIVHTHRSLEDAPPELWFEDPKTKRKGRLFIPDLRGETFQDQWTDRRWAESYRDDLNKIRGILLFIRADTPASNQELLGAMVTMRKDTANPLPWEPRKASPQVQLVDVLQFIDTRGNITRPIKLALMVSAWDTFKPDSKQPKDPGSFVTREWGLLDQYLRANSSTYLSKVYGVSALGGTEEELKELSRLPPQKRARIVDGLVSGNDLTRPLRWMLGID
jgi:GTPase SAR1 family protein